MKTNDRGVVANLKKNYGESKKYKKGELQKQDIIDTIVNLKLKENYSTKSLLDYLKTDLGFSKSQAYEYIKYMYEEIKEDLNIMKENAYDEAISRYEEMLEKTKDNPKIWNELHKEFSKLLGLYREKIDITSNGETINTTPIINITVVNPKQD